MAKRDAKRDTAVDELHKKCGLSVKDCRAALAEHGGDVDATLAALIDTGRVTTDQLNPDTVSDELFERAARKEKLKTYEQMKSGELITGFLNRMGANMNAESAVLGDMFKAAMGELLGDKTPEELVAEEEKDRAEKFEQLKRAMPGIKRDAPLSVGESARIHQKVKQRSDALKEKPVTLKLLPFPPLTMTLSEWKGQDVLKAWAGTQERQGGYSSRSSSKPSKGTVSVRIPRLDEDDADPKPPAPEQLAAYKHLKENGDEVRDAVLEALLDYYTKLRKRWLKNNPDLADKLPEVSTTDQLRKIVGVGIVHMHDVAKSGHAYIGLEMGCDWDDEHGAGVLLHKSRVISVGQADESFDEHAAIKDGAKPLKRK